MNPFLKLERLTVLAKRDQRLRQSLLATAEAEEPLMEFCRLAQKAGVDLSVGELFAIGEEYCDNQCKSTNGGNPTLWRLMMLMRIL